MPKIGVAFCRLDARDDPMTGYSTVVFYDKDKDRPIELTQEQETLAIFMEREYLTSVAALQDKLEAKYSKLFGKIQHATPADEDAYGSALPQNAFEAAKKLAKKEFPGREAEYYT